MTTSDPIGDAILSVQEVIKHGQEYLARLRRMHGKPVVQPVGVYWWYGKRVEDRNLYNPDFDTDNPIERVYRTLSAMLADGSCSPVGVLVDQRLYDMAELEEMFGES